MALPRSSYTGMRTWVKFATFSEAYGMAKRPCTVFTWSQLLMMSMSSSPSNSVSKSTPAALLANTLISKEISRPMVCISVKWSWRRLLKLSMFATIASSKSTSMSAVKEGAPVPDEAPMDLPV